MSGHSSSLGSDGTMRSPPMAGNSRKPLMPAARSLRALHLSAARKKTRQLRSLELSHIRSFRLLATAAGSAGQCSPTVITLNQSLLTSWGDSRMRVSHICGTCTQRCHSLSNDGTEIC